MICRKFSVCNTAGIHCRPSSVILNAIKKEFPDCRFEVRTSETSVELDSILALISLGLSKGTTAELRVSGPNEEAAAKRIGDLFEYEFDFPPRV